MAKNKLELIIAGDAKGALRAFGQAGMAGDTFGNKMKGIAKHAALLGGAAIVGGIAAVGVGLYKAFEPANRLEAQMAKTNIVFGDSVGIVKTWAAENARAMGMGATAVAGLAANMGDLLIPMGFTRDVAADMSTKMTGLSGALSSWTGGTKSAAEVAVVLQKSLLGNRDGLSELGIKIMDSDVKLRMLANGTSEYTGQLREQAVAQATMELIFEKSTDAQNAFKDSTVTNYEKQLQLKGMFEEVKEKVLTALIPVYDKLLTWSLANWPTIESVADQALTKIKELGQKIATDVWPVLQQKFVDMGVWWAANGDTIKQTASDMLNAIIDLGTWLKDDVLPPLATAVKFLADQLANFNEKGNIAKPIIMGLGTAFATIKIAALGAQLTAAATGMSALGASSIFAAGPIGIAAAAILGLAAASEALSRTPTLGEIMARSGAKAPSFISPHSGNYGGTKAPPSSGKGAIKAMGFAEGGMVPGTGPQLAVVHGGERVLTPQQQKTWNMGGVTIYIQAGPTAEATADRVVSRIAGLGIA